MQQQNATELTQFVQTAKMKGASDKFLSTLLGRCGWPADDIYAGSNAQRNGRVFP